MTAILSRPEPANASAPSVSFESQLSMPFLDDLQVELAALCAANEELLASHGLAASPAELSEPNTADSEPSDAISTLQAENEFLRARVNDLERHLAAIPATNAGEQRQRELEDLLDEKTKIIGALEEELEELKEKKGSASGEIEHAFRELEEDRRRLQEDEQGLQNQLREMETTLARERAELSRQRADVQRLQADLQREVDNAARDPQLRERLQTLQRRPGSRVELPRPVEGEQPRPKTPVPTPARPKSSGLFRRLFGGSQS